MNIVRIYKLFPDHKACIDQLEKVRWAGKPACPYCKSDRVSAMKKENRHHCNNCKTSFSVTVATIFHNSKLDLQKWFLAISLILNAKKGLSSRQLARDLEVNKNTAWYMGMRIRKAMIEDSDLLKGIVEVDETYVGGKPRKGNDKNGGPNKRGRGTKKVPVVGMVERNGKVRARPYKKLDSRSLASLIRGNIDPNQTIVMTDEYKGYNRVRRFVPHFRVKHAETYADGIIHTNNIEGFWSLLKRGVVGQYHKVSEKHLWRYVNEFSFRYNHRKDEDLFGLTLSRCVGAA